MFDGTHKALLPVCSALPYQDHDVLLGTKVRERAAHGELVTQKLVETDSSAQVGGHDDTYKKTVLQHTYVGGLQPRRAVESFLVLCRRRDPTRSCLLYIGNGLDMSHHHWHGSIHLQE